MAKAADLTPDIPEQLFIGALLHEVGALAPEDKIAIRHHEVTNPEVHCVLGERLLAHLPRFERASQIVRFHHTGWEELGKGTLEPLMLQSQIHSLADTLRGAPKENPQRERLFRPPGPMDKRVVCRRHRR